MFLNNELIVNTAVGQATYAQSINSFENFVKSTGFVVNERSRSVVQDAWQEIYGQLIQVRQRINGADIIDDLRSRAKPIPVGKFVGTYQMLSGMMNTTTVSIDGGTEATYNHIDVLEDGDPIVMFKEGAGVNWRMAESWRTVDIDAFLESTKQAMFNFNSTVVDYHLNGNANISFKGYGAEGLFTHRNTAKINLGASGYAINLTTANPEQSADFLNKFKREINANYIMKLDVLWVSPEIMSNWSQSMAIVAGGDYGGNLGETVLDYLKVSAPTLDIRESFGLKGNQFLGYLREGVNIRVGMPASIINLERPTPYSNHNAEIISVEGINIMTDANGSKSVFFGGDFS